MWRSREPIYGVIAIIVSIVVVGILVVSWRDASTYVEESNKSVAEQERHAKAVKEMADATAKFRGEMDEISAQIDRDREMRKLGETLEQQKERHFREAVEKLAREKK